MSALRRDDVRALRPDEIETVLVRIGVDPNADHTLETLQWAFLRGSPFHNIDLLAGTAPRTAEECIEAVVSGRGGTCHVQATGFLALLRGLGFDAHLAAGFISQANDHLVVVAHVDSQSFVCDVGNGHPYRRPFPLDEPIEIDHLGWHLETEIEAGQLRLRRRLDDGTWRVVYTVNPQPKCYADFIPSIAAHHEQAGFGPFLLGLRAVLIRNDLVLTLRDLRYTRYSAVGKRERRVSDSASARRVLRRTFGFDNLPVGPALDKLRQTDRDWSAKPSTPPRIVVALATTDRPEGLERLLASLEREWAQHGCTDRLMALVLENSGDPQHREANRQTAARFDDSGLDVRLVDTGQYRRPIADSRFEQTLELARMNARGEQFDVVWMLDDDVVLEQLVLRHDAIERRSDLRYFDRIEHHFNESPEASVLVGGVCGDPPIRPEAVLQTQLFDMVSNLERFMALDPDDPYAVPAQRIAFALPDFYYDHSQAGIEHLTQPFYWMSRKPGQTVREAARSFTAAMDGAFTGRTPTRPLLRRERGETDLESCLLRGGNTVFVDLDALFRHAYPAVDVLGVRTRRSDMVGATRLASSGGTWCAGFDCPVLHLREGQTPGDAPLEAQRSALLDSMKSEFGGVLLARVILRGLEPSPSVFRALARERMGLVIERLCRAAELAGEADASIARARTSWMGDDDVVRAGLDRLEYALNQARALYFGGDDLEGWIRCVRSAIDVESLEHELAAFAIDGIDAQCDDQLARFRAALGSTR